MITFDPLAAPFGSRVAGLEFATLDADHLAATLVGELERQGVLVVRDVDLSPADLVRVGHLFGSVEPAASDETLVPGHNEIIESSNLRDDQISVDDASAAQNLAPRWHADGSFLALPPWCSISYALEVPRRGGQTQFADMRLALRLLPPEDRDEIDQLRLVHRHSTDAAVEVEHPWVRTNGDGSRSLYMGAHASHIAGRTPDDSRQWFAEIEAQLPVHDVFYEHQWQPRDLVVYDNRTIMHRTLGYDIANERRVLHTVRVAGDPSHWPTTDRPATG